jgi:hypothetical protein
VRCLLAERGRPTPPVHRRSDPQGAAGGATRRDADETVFPGHACRFSASSGIERDRFQSASATAFTDLYDNRRPHRSLEHRATPAAAYAARPKAAPGNQTTGTHDRVRTDRIDADGKVTLRHAGRLYNIGAGRTHARTRVLLLDQDLHIRIIDAATGELLRELTLDPSRNYQPTGRPPGPPPGTPRQRKHPEP